MYSLLIETSTSRGALALGFNDKVVRSVELQGSIGAAKYAHDLCQDAGIAFSDLSFCMVGIGPGSYTGIRVAVSFAKGIALALRCPLIPISSLYGFIPEEDGTFIAAFDAKIGGIFTARGRKIGKEVEWESAPERLSDAEFCRLADLTDIVVTNEREWIAHKKIEIKTQVVSTSPCCEELIRYGWHQFQMGKGVMPKDVHPLYLRKTQAEIEKDHLIT